jgi:predicted phosphodiesterase
MFADPSSSEQMPQLAKYMTARAAYSGIQYPAMGNHECTGATASNCGTGATDGVTKNMTDFIATMLAPISVTTPYYTEQLAAADGSWTAKLVVVACNAWSADQATWLDAQLAPATTYTFVVRHEGVAAMSETPCAPSQTIITAHPLTLLIVGHTHEYRHYASDREIIVGNGGAPLTSGVNYGYVIVVRNADGTLTITAYDYKTHAVLDSFSIKASGAAA